MLKNTQETGNLFTIYNELNIDKMNFNVSAFLQIFYYGFIYLAVAENNGNAFYFFNFYDESHLFGDFI